MRWIIILIFISSFLISLWFIPSFSFAADTIKLGSFDPITPTPTTHVILPTDTPAPDAPTSTSAPHRPTNTPAPHATPPPRDPCQYRYPSDDNFNLGWAKIAILQYQGLLNPSPAPQPTDDQWAQAESQAWQFNDQVSRKLYNSAWLYTKGMVRLSIAQGFGLDRKQELYNTFATLSCEEKTNRVASYLISPLFFYPSADMRVSTSLPNTVIIPSSYPKNGVFDLDITKDGTIHFTNGLISSYFAYDNPEVASVSQQEDGRILRYQNLDEELKYLAEDVGLNDKETDVFVDYFLKRLPKANYYIATLLAKDQAEKFMPWKIDPVPDTQIRLLFAFQPLLKEPKNIQTQRFPLFRRKGFTVLDFAGIILY